MQYSYKCVIYWDHKKSAVIDHLGDKLLDIVGAFNGEVSTGGPCWGPYVQYEADTLKELKQVYKKIIKLLDKYHATYSQ